MTHKKAIIDDGFCPQLIEGAKLDGIFEIPHINCPKAFRIPNFIIPFSQINRGIQETDAIGFFEFDVFFADILRNPDLYIDTFKKYFTVITLDCSIYRDMPFAAQVANTYRNRALGYYFQKNGVYTVPLIRWGDERSYTKMFHSECLAFQGVDKHSIYAVSSYGCLKKREDKYYFQAGLNALMEELEPKILLAYGSDSPKIYGPYEKYVKIIHYPDWISLQKGGE